jgi:hypothetical protein
MTRGTSTHVEDRRPVARLLGRRGAAALASAALLLTGVGAATATTQVTVKNPGGLIAVGPISGDNGFPTYYEDSAHTRLELCLDGTNPLCGFLPGDIPNDTVPIAFPDNFPEEAFYMLAGSTLDLPGGGTATLTLGLEAAFANGVEPGGQMVFARQRLVVKGGPANTTVTLRHPYGAATIDLDGTGAGRLVEDVSPAVGNFTAALAGNIGPFLKWDPATAPAAPVGYLGDPAVEHSVIGSPTGFNQFAISGGGLDVSTDQFTVQGKISTNHGVKADVAVLNGDMLDVFATSAGSELQVKGVDGVMATTPMLTDPGSNRFYARVHLTGPAPTNVTVENISDKPISTSSVPVTAPVGITITQADYDGTNLTVAATSTTRYPLTVVGLGDLPDATAKTFPVGAPPASVTVKNAAGGTATLPVTITGGPASSAALPPVTPAADPGPVVDTGTGAVATGPQATIVAAANSVPRGTSTTLDGSFSSGATSYAWSQVPGPLGSPEVTIVNANTAKPTVTIPFYAKTTNTTPLTTSPVGPAVIQLTVTGVGADGSETTDTTNFELGIVNDNVAITTARHRLGTELRIDGTSAVPGATGPLTPGTAVVVYDTTAGRAVTKLGNVQVDNLGNWSLKLRPGPRSQVGRVLIQSTRGGTAESAVTP